MTHIAPTVTINAVAQFLKNKYQIYRYKKEIRTNFGYRLFTPQDTKTIRDTFSVLFAGNANKDTLKEQLCKELDKHKIERLNDEKIEVVINTIQASEEKAIFAQINTAFTEDHKNYIDDYILSSPEFDGVCQFLRQDSGASTRESVKEEIKRLTILEKLPIN